MNLPFFAFGGPPFLTDDPEPVEYQHWEFYTFSQATHVHDTTTGSLPGFEVNYGALPETQLHIVAPFVFDQSAGNDTPYGYGDTEIGIKYRFIKENADGWRPQIGIFPMLELPTGDSAKGLGSSHARGFLPLWIQKSNGPWTTYGGGGYWINTGEDNRDYCFLGWTLQRQVTDALSLGGEMFYQTADTISGRSSTGFNLGCIYDFTKSHHLLLSVGRAIQHASTQNEFSYYLAYQLTI